MATFSRTWWGQKFIHTLETFSDAGRLSRGRSYASGNKVKQFDIQGCTVTALVRGSINSYFGVHEEPLYSTTIEFKPISAESWGRAIALIASNASLISRLLLNEMPDSIDAALAPLNLNLLPRQSDFTSHCSCPDWNNPCKHIAGVYYLVAAKLDQDPFLLFELRGLARTDLHAELAKTPLGQALSAELSRTQRPPQPAKTYHTRPQPVAPDLHDLRQFWHGAKRLPPTVPSPQSPVVPAIPIKQQGDFPAFWQRDNSFIAVMESLYERVRTKNQTIL